MAKMGKRLKKAYDGIDPTEAHRLGEAVQLIKSRASAKFDETVEIAMNLNLDPRKPDQNLRGTGRAGFILHRETYQCLRFGLIRRHDVGQVIQFWG